jgi:hypothetical protein
MALLTPMPNCFMEVTNQNRWNSIWAVATATCFLFPVKIEDGMGNLKESVLFEKNACLVYEFATVGSEVLL